MTKKELEKREALEKRIAEMQKSLKDLKEKEKLEQKKEAKIQRDAQRKFDNHAKFELGGLMKKYLLLAGEEPISDEKKLQRYIAVLDKFLEYQTTHSHLQNHLERNRDYLEQDYIDSNDNGDV